MSASDKSRAGAQLSTPINREQAPNVQYAVIPNEREGPHARSRITQHMLCVTLASVGRSFAALRMTCWLDVLLILIPRAYCCS